MLKLESRIQSVSVFNPGAEVTRTVAIPEQGVLLPAKIAIENLPLCLLDRSLRAIVKGGAEVVDVTLDIHLESTVSSVEKGKEELDSRSRSLNQEIENLEWWLRLLTSYSTPQRPLGPREEAPLKLSPRSRLLFLEFLADQIEEKQERLWDKLDEREQISIELELLDRKSHEQVLVNKVAYISLEGKTSLNATDLLQISYRVPGARWAPSYVLRFNEQLNEAQVSLRVSVAQNTGEDWNNVLLSVSTANPEQHRELPELPSLKVGKRQPAPPSSEWDPPVQDASTLFREFDRQISKEGGMTPVAFAPTVRVPTREKSGHGESALDDFLFSAHPLELMSDLRSGSVVTDSCRQSGSTATRTTPTELERVVSFRSDRVATLLKSTWLPNQATTHGHNSTIPRTLLRDYSRLVLPGPQKAGRGRLVIQTLQEQLSEKARESGLDGKRFLRVVETARKNAEEVVYQALPDGLSTPCWPGEESFDLTYSAGESRFTVLSDGAFHSHALKSFKLAFEPKYIAVPRAVPKAFRFVQANNVPSALPRGPADIYVDNAFLLSGPLDGAAPGGILRIALGVEERVRLVRRTRFQEAVSGLVSKTRRLEHTIEVDVVSNLRKPALVEVRERLPQPRQDAKSDIDVAETRSVPDWEAFEPEAGFLGARRWTFEIAPGEKKELSATYTIAVAAKYDLQSGNRRE